MLRFAFAAMCLAATPLLGQGIVEYGATTGAGASAIGGAGKGLGKSIATIMDKVEGKVDEPARQQTTAERKRTAQVLSQPVPSGPSEVDDSRSSVKPDAVKTGMSKAELFAVAGKPYTKITMNDEGRCIEKLSYLLQAGGRLRVELTDGKVTQVEQISE